LALVVKSALGRRPAPTWYLAVWLPLVVKGEYQDVSLPPVGGLPNPLRDSNSDYNTNTPRSCRFVHLTTSDNPFALRKRAPRQDLSGKEFFFVLSAGRGSSHLTFCLGLCRERRNDFLSVACLAFMTPSSLVFPYQGTLVFYAFKFAEGSGE